MGINVQNYNVGYWDNFIGKEMNNENCYTSGGCTVNPGKGQVEDNTYDSFGQPQTTKN